MRFLFQNKKNHFYNLIQKLSTTPDPKTSKMASRVTRSITNPPAAKAKEKSPESSQVKKAAIVKKPRKEPEIFQVEAILDKKKMNGIWRYKIKWQGYSVDECTWEPAKNLENVKSMVKEFNETWEEPEESDKEESEKSDEKKTEKKSKSTKPKDKEKKEKKGSEKEAKRERKKNKKEDRSESPKKKLKTEKESDTNTIVKGEYGNLAYGDKIKKLLVAKNENSAICFTVEWEPRKDGTVPKRSLVSNTELRKHNKDLLLDYYEERLKFIKPSNSKASVDKTSANNVPEEPAKKPDTMEEEKTTAAEKNADVETEKTSSGVEIEDEGNKSKGPKHVEQKRSSSDKENMDVSNLIQNEGQMIFADLGDNIAPELRDLALDPNLNIYDQAETATGIDKKDDLMRDNTNDEIPNFEGLEE